MHENNFEILAGSVDSQIESNEQTLRENLEGLKDELALINPEQVTPEQHEGLKLMLKSIFEGAALISAIGTAAYEGFMIGTNNMTTSDLILAGTIAVTTVIGALGHANRMMGR